MKSVKPKEASSGGSDLSHRPPNDGGRNAEVDFQGREAFQRNTCLDHGSRWRGLYRKGPGMETRLAFMGHTLMENRSGLLVDARLTRVSGHAERVAALAMIEARADRPRAITLGADRGYDAEDFVNELRAMNVRPHVAQNLTRRGGSGNRWTHDPPPWICREPAHPETHRGRFRLDEDGCRPRPPRCVRGIDRVGGGAGRSPSLRLLTISCASPSCSRRRVDGAAPGIREGLCRALAHRRDGHLGPTMSSTSAVRRTSRSRGAEDGAIAFVARQGIPRCPPTARETGKRLPEFTFEGFDEEDPICGRGWASLGTAGRLVGHIYIHNGDDSGFVCEPG